MTTDLLDAAYYLCKGSFSEPPPQETAAKDQLAQRFPGLDRPNIDEAYSRAASLIDTAYKWADQYRGPKNDGTGVPTINLETECPGFSAAAYYDAQGWGLLQTR